MSEAGILVPQSKANVSNPEPAPRILIIDDEAAIRESLETLLVLEGYVSTWPLRARPGSDASIAETMTWFCWTWRCRGKTAWRFWPASGSASPTCR